jgi:heat shock protein 5
LPRPTSHPLSLSRSCVRTDNQEAEKDDFDEKLKEVQDVCAPIISNIYKESGGAPGGGDFGGDDDLDGHDEL